MVQISHTHSPQNYECAISNQYFFYTRKYARFCAVSGWSFIGCFVRRQQNKHLHLPLLNATIWSVLSCPAELSCFYTLHAKLHLHATSWATSTRYKLSCPVLLLHATIWAVLCCQDVRKNGSVLLQRGCRQDFIPPAALAVAALAVAAPAAAAELCIY